jgi:hypothetical protein
MRPRRSDGNSRQKVIVMTTNEHQNWPQSTAFSGPLRFSEKKIAWLGDPKCEILGKIAIPRGQNLLKRGAFWSKMAAFGRIGNGFERVRARKRQKAATFATGNRGGKPRAGQNRNPKITPRTTNGSRPITSPGRLKDSLTTICTVLPSSRVMVRLGNRCLLSSWPLGMRPTSIGS